MNLSNARATFGLQAKATPTSSNISGSVQIGASNETISFPTADVAYSLRAIFAGNGDVLSINLTNCSTTGSTAFVAGNAQVETATAAGTISASGNATVTVTAAGMTGSPKAISVAVVAADTATVWAGKVRTALAADAAVSALFSVSGATTSIILTRKPTSSHTVPNGTLNLYAADIPGLNIALANGTCTGITNAGTSTNTLAGVISDGVKIYDGDGKDFEGDALATISAFHGLLATGTGSISYSSNAAVYKGGIGNGSMLLQSIGDMPLTFTSNHSAVAELTITVIGTTA